VLITKEFKESGVWKVLKCLKNSLNVAVCGLMMAPAFVIDQPLKIMFGLMTSFTTELTMGVLIGCSISWMSLRGNA